MTAATLTPLLYGSATLSWASAVILVRLSMGGPRVGFGALTERAWAGVAISCVATIYAVLATLVDDGFVGPEDSRVILRASVIVLACVPAVWIYRFWGRRW